MIKNRVRSKSKILLLNLLFAVSCSSGQIQIDNDFSPPQWTNNANIYEVNVRQYTNEGTFNSFSNYLPKLKEMGVNILWFMPVHPIGIKNRKGSLGSYYSVRDYKGINPEFGTLDDFKIIVKQIHDLGMYVIIDWVANHSSWDNKWTETHPEFYTKDENGNFVSPFDWTDVIDLNYDNKELWNEMRDAMKYWIDECDIDGFRCDVAAMVPLEFWKWVRPQLEDKKKIFMLAEAHEPEMHKAFDMTYNWQLKDLFVEIAKGTKNSDSLYKYFSEEKFTYPPNAYRMTFTTNHDENSWNGTDQERYGNLAENFAVLSCVVNGMPLVYSGMEGGLTKRLKFFEKDPINWKENKYYNLYQELFRLKKNNTALWNGASGGAMQNITTNDPGVYSFIRANNDNKVFAVFNFSGEKKNIVLNDEIIIGNYRVLFSDKTEIITKNYSIIINPYSYFILYR